MYRLYRDFYKYHKRQREIVSYMHNIIMQPDSTSFHSTLNGQKKSISTC